MKFEKNFFAIILVGGLGSRFSRIKESPKQLIKLNKRSLLENQLIFYTKNNIKNFIFPLGYKNKFFINFFKNKKKINNLKIKIHYKKTKNLESDKINIILFNSGKKTSKLDRIKKSLNFIENEKFLVSYGDGIANINFRNYLNIFKKYKKSIIACKKVNSQFGHLNIIKNKIISFDEKPVLNDPINIGYYLLTKKIFKKFYQSNTELENNFIKKLIKKNKIIPYIHRGFFFNIDRKIDLDNIKKKFKKIILTL